MSPAELPEHLRGALWAYDEDARAIVCLVTRAGFRLQWLTGWGCTHEGLQAVLPPLATRTLHATAKPLVGPSGRPLELRHSS